jgi:hypothetical protein
MSPPALCPNSVSFGSPVPPHLSFVARSHQLPSAPRKMPSQSRPYHMVRSSHPLLNKEPWHPNQMLTNDVAPVVNMDTEEQELAWCSLYLQFRESFPAQLSLCLISCHDLLTRRLHLGSASMSDSIMSHVSYSWKVDDKYPQNMYVW